MSPAHRLSRPYCSVVILAMILTRMATAADAPHIIIKGDRKLSGEIPVVVELNSPTPAGHYSLIPSGGGPSIPADVFLDGGKEYIGLIVGGTANDEPQNYRGRLGIDSDSPHQPIGMQREGANVRITVEGRPFTVYRTDLGPKPILYPLIGPAGARMTRDYPMAKVAGEDQDHPHQRSCWFTHGKVNGVDFWTEGAGHGSIKETAKLTVVGGAAVGVLRTTDDWLGPDGRKVCEDERVLRVYATRAARVLDYEVTLKATAGPVTLGDTKEGTFGVRVASSMDANRKPGGTITNAEGLTDLAAWGKPSPWVDYVGPVAGEPVGVAILDHPASFRHPTTWHVRDYGLFAANPFGLRDFGRQESGDHTIPAGGSITFRYRVLLHAGDTAAADIPRAFRAFATPPMVEVRGD